jgi:hypothetical protein
MRAILDHAQLTHSDVMLVHCTDVVDGAATS